MKDEIKDKTFLDNNQDNNYFSTLESFETSVINLIDKKIPYAQTNRFKENIEILNTPKNYIYIYIYIYI